ncbi:hypothetical protein [Paenibacillus sp. SI8]|uniref:hypothetical protein n=1 Tax=unclassified Paenibacillus TaxID=185978 RepID=UPI003466226C
MLLTAEAAFWILAISFLLLRYWYNNTRISQLLITLLLANEGWIIFLGVMDFKLTRILSPYQLIIAVIFLYALFFGRSDLRKLDQYMMKKVRAWKGEPLPEAAGSTNTPRVWNTRAGIVGFFKHLILYLALHAAAMIYIGVLNKHIFSEGLTLVEQFVRIEQLFSSNRIMNTASGIWTTVLMVEIIYVLFCTFTHKNKV